MQETPRQKEKRLVTSEYYDVLDKVKAAQETLDNLLEQQYAIEGKMYRLFIDISATRDAYKRR